MGYNPLTGTYTPDTYTGTGFGQAGSNNNPVTPFGQAGSAPRAKYNSRKNQTKAYKPTGVVFQGPASTRTSSNFTYGAGNPVTKNPKTNEYRAGERGQGKMKATKSTFTYSAPSTSKPKAAKKDTSFAKSGVAGVLKSPEAKKFRKAFAKKGLIPALRGK
jgi:hypothetical protein